MDKSEQGLARENARGRFAARVFSLATRRATFS